MASRAKSRFTLYDHQWDREPGDSEADSLVQVEQFLIQHGGKWTNKEGREIGNGLFYHYKRFQQLVWPEYDHHRWSDLILETILKERITVVSGCKDSGKTHVALARFGLTDYLCFPNDTLILMSSTDVRGLELRVWGEVKLLFTLAKERFPWMPGKAVDHLHGLFSDDLGENCDIRDQRKGLICFVCGTMVDTPSGQTPIEYIQPDDLVLNATGTGSVKAAQCRFAKQLVRVTLSDGRFIDCTPEHPFLTQKGWTKAVDLETSDKVFSASESMQILRQESSSQPGFLFRQMPPVENMSDLRKADWEGLSKSQVLLQKMQSVLQAEKLRTMRKYVPPMESEERRFGATCRSILQHGMCRQVGLGTYGAGSACHQTVQALQKDDEERAFLAAILLSEVSGKAKDCGMYGMRENVYLETIFRNAIIRATAYSILQHSLQEEGSWSSYRQKESNTYPTRTYGIGAISKSHFAISHKYSTNTQSPDISLYYRRGVSRSEIGSRNKWRCSSHSRETEAWHKKDSNSKIVRVVSVRFLERRGDKRFNESKGGYPVYNLEVEDHPSFSVNGVIVHNCIPLRGSGGEWKGLTGYSGVKQRRRRLLGDEIQFTDVQYLTSIEHMDKGNFKGVFCLNPLGQGDPGDRMSEPELGWGTEPESEKTEVWRNKWGGITINLDGRDTPNNDEPKNSYPYLISTDDIERTEKRCGRDSMEFWTQVVGKRKPGLWAHRVLTSQMCTTFGAFDSVTWINGKQTKIYAIDAAYGGDRCVAGAASFGYDVNGQSVLVFEPQVIIPIMIGNEIPEDQIARFVMQDCQRQGIPANHVFFDSTGRGSLGTSFGRIWAGEGVHVNPVEFGGKATSRPVCDDMYIYDEDIRSRRLKRCDEHYSKFVTELWFSVRYLVESKQARNFPKDAAYEFGLREWYLVKGDRREIETKEECKRRMGSSPDCADQIAILVEGARRLGFSIRRMDLNNAPTPSDNWKRILRERVEKLKQAHQLNYAA